MATIFEQLGKKFSDFVQSFLKKLPWYKEPEIPKDDATPIEAPDNRLLHPGRPVTWITPGGKRIDQYDSGYFTEWFTKVIQAHWKGISYIYTAKTGNKVVERNGYAPVSIKCDVLGWLPVPSPTVKSAVFTDDGTPCPKIPDHVVWWITFPGKQTLMFGHAHGNDTMRDKHGLPRGHWYNEKGEEIFSWVCNHPHVVVMPDGTKERVDIRYTGGDRAPGIVGL